MLIEDKKLIFLHLPKNCGKSVETFLADKTIGNPHAKDWKIRNCLAVGGYSDYFSFGIIRNPIDRIISVYNHYKGGGVGIQHDKKVQKKLQNISFDEFVDKIDEYKGKLISEYMLGQQYRWFFEGSKQIVTTILSFDNIPYNVISLGEQFGIKKEFPWINKSKSFVNIDNVKLDTFNKLHRKYKKDFEVLEKIRYE